MTVATLLVLLAAATVAIAILYLRAVRPSVAAHQQPLVERTQRQAASEFRVKPESITETSYPLVMELTDKTCVELRPYQQGDGGYLACYNTRTGRLVETRATSAAFGA